MFDIKVGEDGKIILSGRFDASQVEKAEAVFGHVMESTTADFSGLEYISSAGISIILKTYKRLQDTGGVLTLTNLSQRIKNVFHVAGLDKVFVIE